MFFLPRHVCFHVTHEAGVGCISVRVGVAIVHPVELSNVGAGANFGGLGGDEGAAGLGNQATDGRQEVADKRKQRL